MLLIAPLDMLLLLSTKRHILFLVYANFSYFSAQNASVSLAARSEESFGRIGKAMRRVGRRNKEKTDGIWLISSVTPFASSHTRNCSLLTLVLPSIQS
jgi:hypothetical protein